MEPLPQVRPDLMAYAIGHIFERERERKILEELALRGHQTTALQEDGDPRLLVATRAGRREIVRQMQEGFSPEALLRAAGGTSAAFLRHFELVGTSPADTALERLSGALEASSTMGVQDPLTTNLHHNRQATLRGSLTQGWVRGIAAKLGEAAHAYFGPTCGAEGLACDVHDLRPEVVARWRASFWVAPPEATGTLRRLMPDWHVLPAGRHMYGFIRPKAGILVVPEEFGAETLERFDTWTASAFLDFELYIDWDAVCYCPLGRVAHQAHVV